LGTKEQLEQGALTGAAGARYEEEIPFRDL
jgi:hypothetical protein